MLNGGKIQNMLTFTIKLPVVKLDSGPILHPSLVPVLKMNRSPLVVFQTGLLGSAEVLSLASM